jgi:hypothetical protein
MLRERLPLVFLSACLLGASASWADDMGYIDCTNHPDDTPVSAIAAKTHETVGSLPCGERFTILQSGFFFTRIQTSEGKVGYIFTTLISHDYSANAAPAPVRPVQAPVKMAARSSNPLSAIAAAFKPKSAEGMRVPAPPPATATPAVKPAVKETSAAAVQPAPNPPVAPVKSTPPAQAQPSTGQVAASQQPTDSSPFPAKSGIIVLNDTTPPAGSPSKPVQDPSANTTTVKVGETFTAKSGVVVQSEAAPTAQVQPKPVQAAAAKPPVSTDNFSAKSAVVVHNERTAVVRPEPAPSPAATASAATADINPPSVSVVLEPQPSTPAEPQPAAAQPAVAAGFQPEAPRAAIQRTRGGGHHLPSMEFFGGYSFARLNNGAGSFTNYSGGMGAFGLNVRWLQLVADSSYNMIQNGNTKVVLYGNHYGPRLFWRRPNRWNIQPFVEGLFGGTRLDTTVSGTGGFTASSRVFSFKVGGGLDIRPSRHIEVRLFDADYYRTAFAGGTTPYQSNYWISTGIVLRLFGRAE